MSYNVTITYTAANDIYNMDKQTPNVKTVAPIPGLSSSTMPGKWPSASKPYLYAADDATAAEYNKDNLFTNNNGAITGIANLSLLTSAQKRWPQSVAMDLMNILEAYLIPQIPIYRAWQTFKMTAELDGVTNTFAVDTQAEASFYVQAGAALKDYGFTVTSEAANENEGG
jgi:hypothetical protein